ncbi:MAG: MOSC domain-containing protein [Acidobacteriota bacterium]
MTQRAKLISINVGLPREVQSNGKTVLTGIFKEPVEGRIQMRRLNLDGDRQADLSVHGGENKAVYVYPSEHYPYWRELLKRENLGWGMFGENLTTEGLFETEVFIGDRFRLGEAEVTVTQPRFPCFKLALKFGREDIIKKFLDSLRSGFYLSVGREGEVGASDEIELIHRSEDRISVTDIVRLYARDKNDTKLLRRVVSSEAVPQDWKDYFRNRLEKLEE